MTKVKILALVVGMILLFVVPATVSAQQPQLPHVFVGTAAGAQVTAWVDGAQVGAAATITDGSYYITVDPGTESWGDKTVFFQIDGNNTAETATFVHGGADELNLTVGTPAAPAAAAVVNLDLTEQNDSGQTGTAVLTAMGTQTTVALSLSAGALSSELVHIHTGQCGADLGGIANELTSFEGGSGASMTTIDVTLASLQDGNHAINAHEAGNAGNYTACANIPTAEVAPAEVAPAAVAVALILYEENDSGQNGSAVLTPVGTQTQVVLDLSYGKRRSGPVNIHLGACGVNLGAVEYELTPFVGQGGSTTMVDATLESLQDGNHVINADYELSFLHAEPVYTSCANIPKVGVQQRVSGSAYIGTAGTNGTNGTNGRDGRDGVDGLNGTNGADGARGASGAAGTAGAAGAAGDDGSNVVGIIAIILAAIAIVAWAAGLLMMRKKSATG